MNSEKVFGLHAVLSLLKSAPQRVLSLYLLKGREDQKLAKIRQLAEAEGVKIFTKARKEMDETCDGNHQGVIAEVKPGKLHTEEFLYELIDSDSATPFILILDGVTDPHNLGACMRSADAAGIQAVVVPKDKSVGLTETVRKVACGAAETVPLVPVTNLSRCLKNLQEKGLWLVGAAGEAEQSVYETSLTGPLGIVMGSEGSGMRRLTRENCDYLAKIPMSGSVSSLNVSVATGVFLFEAVRQRS